MRTPAEWSKECIKRFGYGVDKRLIAAVQNEAIAESVNIGASLTHPQIDFDYNKWFNELTQEEKNFLNTQMLQNNLNAVAMFVWTRSRETVRENVTKEKVA